MIRQPHFVICIVTVLVLLLAGSTVAQTEPAKQSAAPTSKGWFGVKFGTLTSGNFNTYNKKDTDVSGGLHGGVSFDFSTKRKVSLGVSLDAALVKVDQGGMTRYNYSYGEKRKLLLDAAFAMKLGRNFTGQSGALRPVLAVGFGYLEAGGGNAAFYMLTFNGGIEVLLPLSDRSRLILEIGMWGSPVSWIGPDHNGGSADLRLMLRTGVMF